MLRPLLPLSLIGLLLTGCAFSRTQTRVVVAPVKEESLKSGMKARVQIGEITDVRSEEKHVLMHKRNAYGTTSAAYVTEQSVADLLRAALYESLEISGFLSSEAPYKLNGKIENFEMDRAAGFWKAL